MNRNDQDCATPLPGESKSQPCLDKRQDERIAELEALVKALYADYYDEWPDRAEEVYAKRMKELGVM